MHIGIIGAGLSGALLAVNLLRTGREPLKISLIESSPAVGRGLAFGTRNPDHLLNVRAGHMSAFEDDPSHFLRWLWARDNPETNSSNMPPSGQAFMPRQIYGEYIENVMKAAIAQHGAAHVIFVNQAAVDLHCANSTIVTLADGRRLYFDKVILCLGNFAPSDPAGITPAMAQSSRYIANPWEMKRLRAIPQDEDVVILGSGLTMVDVIQSLQRHGHTGPIDVISRRGLVPIRHKAARPYRKIPSDFSGHASLLATVRWLRQEAKQAAKEGYDWRSVIDALRPFTTRIWQSWVLDERRRFLHHVRPYWEIHRHRLAPQLADDLQALQQSGRLRVRAGRIRKINVTDGGFDLALTLHGREAPSTLKAPWIINCSGPECDYENISDELVKGLLKRGFISADPLRLGLDVTNDGAIKDRNGVVSPTLFAVGPPTRGAFWESTAVPDIRRACARLARFIVAT